MKLIKFRTENFENEAKKVGEVVIGNEATPVYEFSVEVTENKRGVILIDAFADLKYEQEFFNAIQKLLDEIGKEIPLFLAFI
jgi:hypothetical protein